MYPFSRGARRAKKELVKANNKWLAPEVEMIVLPLADYNHLCAFGAITTILLSNPHDSSTISGVLRPIMIAMTI